MKYQKLLYFLQNVGKNPSALIYEDELTGLNNRRYLFHHCQNAIDWQALDRRPVSLVMINIDYFKRINNQYGHNTGDQALIHTAESIRTAAPENGVCVRYAGDSFFLLLPDHSKPEVRSIAEKLLHQIRRQPFSAPEAGTRIPLSLSIGIAGAPGDAADIKNLIHKADTAMQAARKAGRDRCMDAEEVSDAGVFPRTALRYLENAGLAGRGDQLTRMRESLRHFDQGQSRMVIVDGAPGIGKTRFLSTIEKDLEENLQPVRVQGIIQEAFRPYYLAAYIAMALMNRLEDKGLSILKQADDAEIDRLAQVIPQIREGEPPLPENAPEAREAVFESFTRFVIRLAGGRPLAVLVDDLHYCDPASLHLIRMLMQSRRIPVFFCGTAAREKQTIGEAVSLDLFRNAYSEELEIQDIALTPLSQSDIETHLDAIFPGIHLPRGPCGEMARVTRGNPLFLTEIIRKMIQDGHIVKKNGKWTVSPLDKEYFPRSLEEIIRLKMNSLDEDSRRFLDQASAFGESTFLSMLAGITRDYSARLYEIIDNAEQQGIVETEFAADDENIRFSSKQVRDIIYDGISPAEKKLLHQQIGIYQESLFQQNLLPSAAFLAHHFSRSDEIEKAREYKEFQDSWNQYLFREDEMENWSADFDPEAVDREETGPETGLGDEPLPPQARQLVPHLLRALLVAVRNTRLYPAGSKSVVTASRDLLRILERIFYTNSQVSITVEGDDLWINGERIRDTAPSGVSANIRALFSRMEIKSLIFKYGTGETELQRVLDEISQAGRKTIPPGFWKIFADRNKLACVHVRQVAYTRIETSDAPAEDPLETPDASPEQAAKSSDTQTRQAQRIIGAFLGTYSKFRLYPAGGPVTREAVGMLLAELQSVFASQPVIVFSRVKNNLLINGTKVDPSAFEALYNGMIRFMSHTGIHSLTLTSGITENDLNTFFQACFELPDRHELTGFWQELANSYKLSGLLINQRLYDEQQIHSLAEMTEAEDDQDHQHAPAGEDTACDESEPQSDAPPEPMSGEDDQVLAARLRDLFLKGETEQVKRILQQMARLHDDSGKTEKIRIRNRFYAVLNPPGWQPAGAYLKLVLSTLMPLIEAETHGPAVRQAADRLHQCAASLILYGEYPAAAWIFSRLLQHPALSADSGMEPSDRPRVLGRQLDTEIVDILRADMKASDRHRRQQACQLISTLGTGMTPMLIEIITREEDIRVRRLAARLLANFGQAGADRLKSALINETREDAKIKILEIIDGVTTELSTELRCTMADANQHVRRAAFRLIQKIDKPETTTLLGELAGSRDSELAAEAINHLGTRKSARAAGILGELAEKKNDPELLCAVCRAMGQHASDRFLPSLEKILFSQGRVFKKRLYPTRVRIAAAYAVSRTPGSRARQIIDALKNDKDPRVREAAAMMR
ncbi:diguanylate cyclase (GGDEF)-like protein [Desulfosalsimonas propionicica]|uniref:diguanylate cyclase n=1 Tax=Desulfosalsimonas propionicica TaxID=332175 RepID=A0A7W0HK82_9BACT|nr:diguanylate cyclase [Desulfosalsimonas propionicica]MBA2881014.1 diguanylate cyclase (GGDEF)-like protein [Desulfosalsimonas propionicica]